MKRSLYFPSLCVAILLLACPARAQDDVQSILAGLAVNPGEPAWDAAESLAGLGPVAEPELSQIASDPGRHYAERMAAAAALLRLGEQRVGTVGLETIAMDDSCPMDTRLEAAQIMGKWGGEYASARLGIMLDAPGVPERLRVELAYSLWKLSSRPRAYEVLEDMRHNAFSAAARAEAVLALAQTDRYGAVREEVKYLSEMPGSIGERATGLMLISNRLDSEVVRDDFTVKLISEVVSTIRKYYAADPEDEDQEKRLSPKSLAESSAQALLYSLDQFNDYMNEEDYADFESQLKANYGGVGAWVGMRDGRFTVLTPMYDKPAYRAGLKPMDVIDRIDDVDITDMKQNDIIKLLKGEARSPVKVRVHRRAWKEPRVVTVIRDIIQIESVLSQALPGDIGYIKINSFNDGDPYKRVKGTADLVKDALAGFNRQGVKGIILDLANNPGGVMVSGIDVAKLFIGERKLIVSSRGRSTSKSSVYNANQNAYYKGPVVVVVNPGTASAAEIVAGAMRDHNRAPLVGRKTYGKGSVQSLMGVSTTRNKSRIKLTVAKYYLPNGDCIHEKGIEPDFKVPETDLSVAELEARWKIRDQHDVMFWLEEDGRFSRHEEAYRELLEFDNLDPQAYPEFDSLLSMLQTKHPKERIDAELARKELRFGLATYLKDFQGENRYVDLEENAYLQEAIVVLGEEMGGLPDTPLFTAIKDLAAENRRKLAEEEGDLAEGN